jgi:hypothetical protein
MTGDDTTANRRTVLKGIGAAAAVGGVGVLATSGSAAATMTSSFTATDAGVVPNDRGDIEEVYVVPRVATTWEGFDEEPTKLRWLLEAGIEGQGYAPVYRETPWLFDSDEGEAAGNLYGGTTGRFPEAGRVPISTRNSAFYDVNGNGDFVAEDDGSQVVQPKTVLYKDGMPANPVTGNSYHDSAEDYDFAADYEGETDGADGETYITGASIGARGGKFANGKYGVLGDTSHVDAPTDGESKTTKINLRLTTVLLKTVQYDDFPTTETLMQDEYPVYGRGNYTYGRLRAIEDRNPCVSIEEASFTVTAENEAASSATNGNANPGVQ